MKLYNEVVFCLSVFRVLLTRQVSKCDETFFLVISSRVFLLAFPLLVLLFGLSLCGSHYDLTYRFAEA